MHSGGSVQGLYTSRMRSSGSWLRSHVAMSWPLPKCSARNTARKGVTRSLMPCTYPLAGCLRRSAALSPRYRSNEEELHNLDTMVQGLGLHPVVLRRFESYLMLGMPHGTRNPGTALAAAWDAAMLALLRRPQTRCGSPMRSHLSVSPAVHHQCRHYRVHDTPLWRTSTGTWGFRA